MSRDVYIRYKADVRKFEGVTSKGKGAWQRGSGRAKDVITRHDLEMRPRIGTIIAFLGQKKGFR